MALQVVHTCVRVRDPEASFPQLAAAARQRYGPTARVQDLATGWLDGVQAPHAGARTTGELDPFAEAAP